MRWFRIRLVEIDFPNVLIGPDGSQLPAPRVRVPEADGLPFTVPCSYVIHAAKGSTSLDGLIGIRSETFTAPTDWLTLDLDAAKLVYQDILGIEPLVGQVF